MKNKYIYLLITLILSPYLSHSQGLAIVKPESVGMSSEQLSYADRVINEAIDSSFIPGAVLAVVHKGSIAYLKAYGDRQLTPKAKTMKPNTVFDIASCTKPVVTATCVMKLVEMGYLTLNDNIDMFIPHFNKGKKYEGRNATISIKNLLTHTSGLVPYVSLNSLKDKYKQVTRDSLIHYVQARERRALPDSVFQYSCINYILLQEIIEKVSGTSLDEFANEHIFDVLGMHDTSYVRLDDKGQAINSKWKLNSLAPTCTMATLTGDSTLCHGLVHDPLAREINKGVSGNAGLFSTASDLALFAYTLLNGGSYKGKRILSPNTVKAMFSIPTKLEKHGRTLGWDSSSTFSSVRGDLLPSKSIMHTGYTGSSILLNEEQDLAIILLTNYVHQSKYELKNIIRLRKQVANTVSAALLD